MAICSGFPGFVVRSPELQEEIKTEIVKVGRRDVCDFFSYYELN